MISARDDASLVPSYRMFPDMFSQSFEHDSNIYTSHLTRAAYVVARDTRSRMWDVERKFYWRYFLRVERNPTPDQVEIWSLIRAMRSWAVHVSGIPFVMLEDDSLNLRSAFPRDEYWRVDVDRRPDHFGNPPEARLIFHAWRGFERGVEHTGSDPRALAIYSTGVGSERIKQFLYQSHPILLLLPKAAVHPNTILHILRLQKQEAIAYMAEFIHQVARPLQRARNRFRAETEDIINAIETNQLPNDTNWNRLSPIVRSAAFAVLRLSGQRNPPERMLNLAHDVLEATSPVRPQDIIFYTAIAVTTAVTVFTLGAGTPLSASASMALVAVDLASAGIEIYLTAAENAVRNQLNSFVEVDAALEVAGPEKSVSSEVLMTAVSFLVPFAIGRVARRLSGRINATGLPEPPQQTNLVRPDAQEASRNANEARAGTNPERTALEERQANGMPMATSRGASDGQPTAHARRVSRPAGPLPRHAPNPVGSGNTVIDATNFTYGSVPIVPQQSRAFLTRFERLIAGTGGIRRIIAGPTEGRRWSVRIVGEILPGRLRRRPGSLEPGQSRAPNFNARARQRRSRGPIHRLTASLDGDPVRLGGHWQRLHLWGPGFGDEAAAGMMVGPRSVNLQWQNSGIEDQIRGLAVRLRAMGGRLHLEATAEAWASPTPLQFVLRGPDRMLKIVQYRVWAELPDGRQTTSMIVDISVPDPGLVVEALRSGRSPPRPDISVSGEIGL